MYLQGLCLLLSLPFTFGLIGFDCGGGPLNITTISLLNVADCAPPQRKINSTDVYIQLLQSAEYQTIPVIHCKVIISRTIFYCGMHSHVSAVHNGQMEYLQETTADQCHRMHSSGTFSLTNGFQIADLHINSTTTRPAVLAGSIDADGSCSGIQYSDSYGSWRNVVVQATIKITLSSGSVPVRTSSGKITLKSGTVCQLGDGGCLDLEAGYTYWNNIPKYIGCDFSAFDVLYEGRAKKLRDTSEVNSPEIYSLVTKETTFALAKTSETRLCGYVIYRTEHPKLYIMETQPGLSFVVKSPITVENLDIFTYVNSKFVFVEKHLRGQITSLYNDVMTQKCELERQVLTNALAYATRDPTEFAYTIMKGPGYTAIPSGEVIHIAKCVPVEVSFRPSSECFNELTVTFRNKSAFLTPKTRILQRFGSRRECNLIFPSLFLTEHGWIRLMPRPIDAKDPETLKPKKTLTWNYLSPGNLATSGIYSQTDIDNLREHLMFPAEKSSITNNLARSLSGKQGLDGGLSAYNMLDEDSLKKIADNTASRLWTGFLEFGSISAGFIGIFILLKLIKLLVDTFLRGYALHSVYGCSLHLLGAVWGAMTHFMLHLAGRTGPSRSDEESPPSRTDSNQTSKPPPSPPPRSFPHPQIVTTQSPPQYSQPSHRHSSQHTDRFPPQSTRDHPTQTFVELSRNLIEGRASTSK